MSVDNIQRPKAKDAEAGMERARYLGTINRWIEDRLDTAMAEDPKKIGGAVMNLGFYMDLQDQIDAVNKSMDASKMTHIDAQEFFDAIYQKYAQLKGKMREVPETGIDESIKNGLRQALTADMETPKNRN